MSASTLPLMSVEPPICSHVLCIFGSLGETKCGGHNGCNPWKPHGWTMMDLGARSCIMIMTIVISIAVWMARYLEEFFGTNGFLPVPIAALVCAMSLFSGRHHSEIYHCAVCRL